MENSVNGLIFILNEGSDVPYACYYFDVSDDGMLDVNKLSLNEKDLFSLFTYTATNPLYDDVIPQEIDNNSVYLFKYADETLLSDLKHTIVKDIPSIVTKTLKDNNIYYKGIKKDDVEELLESSYRLIYDSKSQKKKDEEEEHDLESLFVKFDTPVRSSTHIKEEENFDEDEFDDEDEYDYDYVSRRVCEWLKKKKKGVIAFGLSASVLVTGISLYIISQRHKKDVLPDTPRTSISTVMDKPKETPLVLPTPSPTPVPTPIPTPEPTPEPVLTEEMKREIVQMVYDEEDDDKEYPDVILMMDTVELEDKFDDPKRNAVVENYGDLITNTAVTYGVSPEFMIAIATQERGEHTENIDSGGGLGLFQIQMEGNWNWNGEKLSAHNYVTGEEDTIYINYDTAKDLDNNAKIACMYIQKLYRYYKGNLMLVALAYNSGPTYVDKLLANTSAATGFSRKELLDPSNTEWINYRYTVPLGDRNYLEHVFRYIGEKDLLTFRDEDGNYLNYAYFNKDYYEMHKNDVL